MNKQCWYPSKGVCITPQGHLSPCCAVNNPQLNQFENINQIGTDPVYTEMTEFNNKGAITNSRWCSVCGNREALGEESLRTRSASHVKRFKGRRWHKLDISFGNTCNLDCAMCSPYFSSKWSANVKTKLFQPTRTIVTNVNAPAMSLDIPQIDELLKIITEIDTMIIKGGEPLYDKRCVYFLERVSEIRPDMDISIITNGTIINKKLLSKLKGLDITVSVDGIGKVYEYIRGHNWKTVDNNIFELQKMAKRVRVQPTISVYNVEHVQDIHDYYIANNVEMGECMIVNNEYLVASHIGEQRFNDAVSKFTFDTHLKYREPSDYSKERFKTFTSVMNKHRGMRWEDL